ncbi:MAG: orotidine-5'-phosphate decarboxylase [Planctomycetota bacterium]
MGFASRLSDEVRARGSALVLGLDPRLPRMPRAYRERGSEGIGPFHARLIELLDPFVVGVKPQIAFFECLGEEGLGVYAQSCRLAREAGLLVIGDVKRGDIGSTAEAYAQAHFAWADAITVNPLLGSDSIRPFLDHCRQGATGIFVVTASSNPSWAEFQGFRDSEGKPLYLAIARAVRAWNAGLRAAAEPFGPVGAVVAATHPRVVAEVRGAAPESWLLMPGVGAQGASLRELAPAFDRDGLGGLVPVSRALQACFDPEDPDWERRVVESARALLGELQDSVPALARSR